MRIAQKPGGPCARCGLSFPSRCLYCGGKVAWKFEPGESLDEGQFVGACRACKRWMEFSAPPPGWEGNDPLYRQFLREEREEE